ncbi:response regulator transcription factor [Flavivirga eckloniae]|uniref:DNA-binding response regulator n=1 Tax=Flavivirga eckloniae TaxID=1803846 RepID=A0A2K9PJY3_9FLAO|nr:response regulator transcription factor [Flavivirga eckloniae]AUP77373.1 DNA-binding response regulator [Flavivirga eckloniae]
MKADNFCIRLGIVDDDLLIVQLLSDFLRQSNNIEVALTALSGNDFLEKLSSSENTLDIVLLDLRMKNGTGLEVLNELLKQPKRIKIIVLSTFYKSSFLGQMLKLGVDAFLPKEIDLKKLIHIIKTVHHKGHYFSQEQIDIMRTQISPKTPKLHIQQKDQLTEREIEVLQLICSQLTSKEIAEKLFVATKTVENHKSNLFLKTGVKNTAGLIIYAIQNKITNPDELIILEN